MISQKGRSEEIYTSIGACAGLCEERGQRILGIYRNEALKVTGFIALCCLVQSDPTVQKENWQKYRRKQQLWGQGHKFDHKSRK